MTTTAMGRPRGAGPLEDPLANDGTALTADERRELGRDSGGAGWTHEGRVEPRLNVAVPQAACGFLGVVTALVGVHVLQGWLW